jgi:hypothetical protein
MDQPFRSRTRLSTPSVRRLAWGPPMLRLLRWPGPRPQNQAIGWFLLGLLLWLARLRLPVMTAMPDLDQSWQQALLRALLQGVRFGRELVFTYGPLGGLAEARYEPKLFWTQILLFEGLFKGLLVWRWLVALRRHPSIPERTVYVLALLCLAIADDAWYEATQIMLGSLLLRDGPLGSRERALDLLLVVAIGFIKFPYFCLGAGVGLLLVLQAVLRSRRELWGTLLLWGVCLFGVWGLCGQRPWDLPIYVLRSAEVAHGYTEAQAQDGPLLDVQLACGSFALLALMATIHVRSSEDRRNALLRALLVAGGVGTAFRASFTCQGGPAVVFFSCVTVAPCAWVLARGSSRGVRIGMGLTRALGTALAVCAQTGVFVGQAVSPSVFWGATTIEESARGLWKLPGLHARREAEKAAFERQYDLPRVRARVGQKGIDMLGSDLAWLFLNRLHWQPRPVLQSYSTSTADLIELNREYFESPAAPEFLLYQDTTIAQRISWMDDCESRYSMLRSYVPVEYEKGLLLLRRHPGRAARPIPAREKVAEFELRPGQPLLLRDIPGELLIGHFDVRYSWFGELRRMLLHAPETRIRIVRDDAFVYDRRLSPDMARAGVLLRPLLEFTDDELGQYLGQPTRRYLSIKLLSTNDWSAYYEPTWRLVVERCDELLPKPQPERLGELLLGSFPTRPRSFTGSTLPVCSFRDGREMVLCAADARMEFELGEQARRLTGFCGQTEYGLRHGDGIDLEVELQPAEGEPRLLWTRTLERSKADSSLVRIDVPIPPAPGQKLVLRWRNQPGHGSDNDQPFLSEIAIGE